MLLLFLEVCVNDEVRRCFRGKRNKKTGFGDVLPIIDEKVLEVVGDREADGGPLGEGVFLLDGEYVSKVSFVDQVFFDLYISWILVHTLGKAPVLMRARVQVQVQVQAPIEALVHILDQIQLAFLREFLIERGKHPWTEEDTSSLLDPTWMLEVPCSSIDAAMRTQAGINKGC